VVNIKEPEYVPDEDEDEDPEWRRTPMFKRIRQMSTVKNFSSDIAGTCY
jgi:hypothetical protein